MKLAAFDLGDRWVGSAISDTTAMFARPYKTVATKDLNDLIKEMHNTESITTFVIGYPKTMKGTESEQTKKVVASSKVLEATFPDLIFVLWDERLTSQQAAKLKKSSSKEDRIKSHSVAAAFILQSYLNFLNNSVTPKF